MSKESDKLERQREEAFRRIDKKLDILELWLDEGIPFKLINGNKQVDSKGNYVLEDFPKSVRGLRLWNGKENSEEVVKKYHIPAAQTSDRAWKAAPSATRIRVEGNEDRASIFALLKEKASIQRSNKQKTRIDELEEKLTFSEKKSNGLAAELVQLRIANKALEKDVRIAETRLEDARHVMSQQLDFKSKTIKQSENDNKTLQNEIDKLKARLIENNIDFSDIEQSNSVISFPVSKDE
ncbi:MAG: hypothetical protein CL578_18210 [Alteromonadaceae bacterium]|jgi:uncharacterized coiled-coil protein SlyX|uniref:Uncharacterized protein n=2 Tax=Paraglaciecola TaxID=1621534 RepID=K6YLM0_9ALTE|nr:MULTISPECIES: hypothetical protein [Paraglaciecola]MBN26965.1 hypothetical protein [Alteromonadaceae bacterium]GAC03049.1 hypothetical protein GAGA_0184 [Paraglaciecola agarilytica NO2]GAC24876.1 hypothetical protein GMES_2581 [Paraglaciecola mesophila KMM 241]|tara:strand:+ start:4317 stop:5030 length:714 start_codon:yes stop_codon:yes gene_type:complete